MLYQSQCIEQHIHHDHSTFGSLHYVGYLFRPVRTQVQQEVFCPEVIEKGKNADSNELTRFANALSTSMERASHLAGSFGFFFRQSL